MENNEIITLLSDLRQQDYPLVVSEKMANAIVECIRRIMETVHPDDHVFVRADYDLATSALCHPVGNLPRTNRHLPS